MHNCGKKLWASVVFCVVTGILASPQTFTTLVNFKSTDGRGPYLGPLVQGTDGKLYGTTQQGGVKDYGTAFKVSTGGTLTSLYSFCSVSGCPDGVEPYSGLVMGTDGNFYGTTGFAGAYSSGIIFKITPSGRVTILYNFCSKANCADGSIPSGALVRGTDGAFYGTTNGGGTNNFGTVFKFTTGGKLTTLHSFNNTDGATPGSALVQGTDGNFYGTTGYGGTTIACGGAFLGCGTVFQITPTGTLTVLHSFNGNDGNWPIAGLIQGSDGTFYGTTNEGSSRTACTHGCGTVFKITSIGTLTTLHTFNGTDGSYPTAALLQATDGNFYGTTSDGGSSNACDLGCGTVFKMTSDGTLTTLHSFDFTDGSRAAGALVQHTNGTLYGTTSQGGTSQACYYLEPCGTVFSLNVGLGPFVEASPGSRPVGSLISILGTNLTGASSVTFNGTSATFTVVSSTFISTTVPPGATTGTIKVTTPHGTLSSNVPFNVLP